jgi:hypothetical protein
LGIIKVSRNSDNCILNWFRKVGFRDLLHFCQNHGGYFLWVEEFLFSLEVDLNLRFIFIAGKNFERPVF